MGKIAKSGYGRELRRKAVAQMNGRIFVHSADELRDFARRAIAVAKRLGADDAIVSVDEGNKFRVSVRNGALDTIERNRTKKLTVTLFRAGQLGAANTADLSLPGIEAATKAAYAIAGHTQKDPFAGPVASEYLVRDPPDLDLFHAWELTPTEAIAVAGEIETAALATDPSASDVGDTATGTTPRPANLKSCGASVLANHHQFALATTRGLDVGYAQSLHGLKCSMVASDGDGMQKGSWADSQRNHHWLAACPYVGRTAAQRAVAQLGARRLPTGPARVLFEAQEAKTLIASLVDAIRGQAQFRRQSYLLDAVGEVVMANHLSLIEEPHVAGAPSSAPFDREGVTTKARTIVEDGVLCTYLLDAYSARRLNQVPTGHAGGPYNVYLASRRTESADDFAAMVRKLGTGLIVTQVIGGGVNPFTGDYSQGVGGLWVENGEICHSVQQVTISGKVCKMLKDIVAVGSDVRRRGWLSTGSVLLDRMQISGN